MTLEQELKSYPALQKAEKNQRIGGRVESSNIAVPFRLLTDKGELSFISTVTVFGTPIDVTLSELAVESFFRQMKKRQRL